ncbi:hypothetical protein IWW47_001270 [Coemansia sp. RSA 2052]|nr:hypothetical protein IWW47_001270 [Coemansia sp. RSA 2052]
MDSFAVSHQLVSLDIDFSRRAVKGVTELSIRPKTGDFRGLRLHCDRPVVRSVTVDGLACSFESVGPTTRQQVLDSISQNDNNNNNNNSSSDDDDEGGGGRRGLIIRFPSEFTATTTTTSSTTTSTTSTNDEVGVLFKQCKVRIEFYLVDSQTGLVFDGTTAYTETRVYPVSVTRAWLPCVDTMHERSTWDLFYTVPAVVPASEGGEEEGVMSCVTVVSVGELTSLVVHPRDATKKIFRYVMSTATPACTLGFAAGPFTSACTLGSSELRQKPPLAAAASAAAAAAVPLREKEEEKDEDDEDEDEGDDEGEGEGDDEDESAVVVTPETVDAIGGIYAFATGGSSSSKDALGELQHTCAFLPEALGFIAQEFGAYPYSSYKIVFIENLRTPTVTCASLTLVDASLLHPAAVIDAAYEARRVLGLAAAAQWFGAYVAAAARADRWLVAGLAGFAAAAYARHSLGRSEHRWRLRRDVQRLCHADVNQRALAAGGDAAFVALKAPLVLHMLDARMRRGGRSLGLARMAAQALGAVAAAAQPLATTAWFLRGCRRVSGVDVGAFAEQWVYGTGCPVLHVACAFNRKKLAVEITVHQESTNARATAPWVRPQQLFRGPLTARIREADGTPYEHVLDIGERVRRFEVQFNTKYKRIRRATKRFHTRQHDQVLIGAESPRAKRAWRAVEWGEADAESLASAAFEWIRVDPDQEWACVVHFAQPAFMWAAQLQRDRDVAAQADAVAALQRLPSAAASTALMRAVMDARMFFRVRVAAALALAVLATERLAWIGLHHLVQIYAARYSSAGDPGADLGSSPIIPRPNDFRDFGEYFTQRAVLAALSNVRGGGRRGGGSGGGGGNNGGVAPAPARRVLLAALRYNDNSANAYADGHYLAGLAAAVANSVPPRRKYQRKAPLLQRPSAAMVSDELVSIDDDDDDDNAPLMLPAIAGTRPPPLVSPDASLNSPVYAGGAPPIKLKLKLFRQL